MPRLKSLSLAIAGLLALLWIASVVRPLVLAMPRTPQDVWFLDADRGRLRLLRQHAVPAGASGYAADVTVPQRIRVRDSAGTVVAEERDPYRRDARSPWWFDEGAGTFGVEGFDGTAGSVIEVRIGFVCVPIWVPVVLAAMPAIIHRAQRAIAWRRRCRDGLCPACGYDLRGTPDRCPECGRTASAGSTAVP